MKRLSSFLPKTCLKIIYNTLFNCHLNYDILLWGHELKKIEYLQKRAIRVLSQSQFLSHTDPLFKKENILKVQDIYNLRCITFFYRYKHDLLPPNLNSLIQEPQPNFHRYPTSHSIWRSNLPLSEHFTRFEHSKQSIRFCLPQIINSLPTDIVSKISTHSLIGVKAYAKKYYISLYNDNTCNEPNCYSCRFISPLLTS